MTPKAFLITDTESNTQYVITAPSFAEAIDKALKMHLVPNSRSLRIETLPPNQTKL